MEPPLPPAPVPVPSLPLMLLLMPISIGMSPKSYDVRAVHSARSKDLHHLNRNKSTSNNTKRDVVTASRQNTDGARCAALQNATVVVVFVNHVVISAGHNIRAESKNSAAVD